MQPAAATTEVTAVAVAPEPLANSSTALINKDTGYIFLGSKAEKNQES